MLLGLLWTNLDLFTSRSGCISYVATAAAVTFLVAILSHLLIEKPAMKAVVQLYGSGFTRLQLLPEIIRNWATKGFHDYVPGRVLAERKNRLPGPYLS